MEETRLPGGNAGGAVLVDGTVRRATGPWTPSVHALLGFLEARGFAGAPRVLGVDERDREILSFLPGLTVGDVKPWPAWVHSEDALLQVGRWLRAYHDVVIDFRPAPDARWRTTGRSWRPGDVIGHNDAAPYNAVWTPSGGGGPGQREDGLGVLTGFIDWDFAAPCHPIWDLAFVAFSWVPVHARHVNAAEGFTRFDERPDRLALLLDAYGFSGTVQELLQAVRARVRDHADGVRELAAGGDPLFLRLVDAGVIDDLEQALAELDQDHGIYRD